MFGINSEPEAQARDIPRLRFGLRLERSMPRLNPFASGRTKLSKLWEAGIDGHDLGAQAPERRLEQIDVPGGFGRLAGADQGEHLDQVLP